MGLTPAEIQALLETFEASTWQEMTIDVGEDHLHVSRRVNGAVTPPPPAAPTALAAAAPPAPHPAAPASSEPRRSTPAAAAPASNGHGVPVAAPSVGLFWRAPSPGAPPFVDVGSRVGPDDTIAIIEVMKLMSPLKAGL